MIKSIVCLPPRQALGPHLPGGIYKCTKYVRYVDHESEGEPSPRRRMGEAVMVELIELRQAVSRGPKMQKVRGSNLFPPNWDVPGVSAPCYAMSSERAA